MLGLAGEMGATRSAAGMAPGEAFKLGLKGEAMNSRTLVAGPVSAQIIGADIWTHNAVPWRCRSLCWTWKNIWWIQEGMLKRRITEGAASEPRRH